MTSLTRWSRLGIRTTGNGGKERGKEGDGRNGKGWKPYYSICRNLTHASLSASRFVPSGQIAVIHCHAKQQWSQDHKHICDQARPAHLVPRLEYVLYSLFCHDV